jgi:hypothetical protein
MSCLHARAITRARASASRIHREKATTKKQTNEAHIADDRQQAHVQRCSNIAKSALVSALQTTDSKHTHVLRCSSIAKWRCSRSHKANTLTHTESKHTHVLRCSSIAKSALVLALTGFGKSRIANVM